MVRSSLARISVGGFSALLSVALLLMVGGLIASDRAMRSAARAQARIDAQQSARAVAEAIDEHVRAGGTLRSITTDSVVLAIIASAPHERTAAAIVAGGD